MSNALLVLNTILCFGCFDGGASVIGGCSINKEGRKNGRLLDDLNSDSQELFIAKEKKIENSCYAGQKTPAYTADHVVNFIETDASDNFLGGRHQIHKRNLNRDFPLNKDFKTVTGDFNYFNGNLEESNDESNNVRSKRNDISSRNTFDRLVLEDTSLLENTNGELKIPNDTTKYSLKPYSSKSDISNIKEEENMMNFINLREDGGLNYVDNGDGVNLVDAFLVNELGNNSIIKRDVTADSEGRSSSNSTTIKDEIDKLYKDISDNVRLLTKLRDKESHLSKKPYIKRWVIIDKAMNDAGKNDRKKRCSQELTVEMDTNRDATPDRLEHIERKIEEEVLQVNVPLKCNQ